MFAALQPQAFTLSSDKAVNYKSCTLEHSTNRKSNLRGSSPSEPEIKGGKIDMSEFHPSTKGEKELGACIRWGHGNSGHDPDPSSGHLSFVIARFCSIFTGGWGNPVACVMKNELAVFAALFSLVKREIDWILPSDVFAREIPSSRFADVSGTNPFLSSFIWWMCRMTDSQWPISYSKENLLTERILTILLTLNPRFGDQPQQ
ncbi:hypothetical protein KQX54_005580 [Cotesia glomerata]|uniref:Uncharacterized protein n=1 Tax=Cotesia glomerata TaxID=32391 RepID=A0AAV7HVR0_COTGL|nr:hypothetical protein KQX54_005580 [Cotesia glomerata]